MRSLMFVFLGLLLSVPPITRAEEAADPVTSQVPKKASVCIRLPSLDKLDAIVKEAMPIIKAIGGPEAAMLEQQPPSKLLCGKSGLDESAIDRTKPIYLAAGDEIEMIGLLQPAAGATPWEGVKKLEDGAGALFLNGLIQVGEPDKLGGEARGAPTQLLRGDLAVHVYLGELVEKHKQDIEAGLNEVQQNAGMMMPEMLKGLIPALLGVTRQAAYGVESLDYAITVKGDTLDCEGRILTKPGSALNKFFARAGVAGDNPLVGFLPKDSFLVIDYSTTSDWPGREMFGLLDGAFGEGMGPALGQLLGMGNAFWGVMTGRAAMAMGPPSMMGMSATMIAELKEGTDTSTLFDKYEFGAINEMFKKLGVPIEYKLEKNISKHGETPIHRLTIASDDPQVGMMLQAAQTYMAAEGRHLFSTMSPTGEQDLKNLIDQVRADKRIDHPHAQAMSRLGRTHNVGISMNLGQLKQMAMMFMMISPEFGTALADLPDDLTLSTAITFDNGNVYWRGDWPIKKISKFVEGLRASQQPQEAKPADDQEFD